MKQTAKKLLSVVLCLVLATGALAVPALAAADLPGDVDGNETVTTADARLALRAAIGLDTLSEEAGAVADVTGDGDVNTDDARIILRAAVGLMRLSEDGKRYEDIPKPGDVLAGFFMKCGEAYDEVYTLDYENETGDTISYRYDESAGKFEVTVYEYYEGFGVRYRVHFYKSFTAYYTDVVLFDTTVNYFLYYARGEYTMDPENLNWNTGSECFTETSYSGNLSMKEDLVYAMSGTMCVVFRLLLEEAQSAGFEITHNDMRLYRLTEPYQG